MCLEFAKWGFNYLDRSAIILGGGSSRRFGEDKGVLKLDNKPLLNHVVDTVKGIVGEVIVVTSSKNRADLYAEMVSSCVRFVIDICEAKGPLVGALTGFEAAQGKYSLLLPFDVPFVSRDVLSLLFELCIGKSAVIPRWPNSQIEPLHAVYKTEQAVEAAKKALMKDELDMRAMICELHGVRYVSTLVIEQLDPDLQSFFNINTPLDLKKASTIIKSRKR
jgi:molybdopterin-guanine dinucleotide biosynthesis protein A